MSLALSLSRPRGLVYAAGGLREDLSLLEVDERLLAEIQTGSVVIKGGQTDEAVLCTDDKTYALKLVETTNTLLLIPGQPEEDAGFAAGPSPLPARRSDASEQLDVGLATQMQKSAAAKCFPPLVATATARAHIEVVEVGPRLDMLPGLLGRPYSLEDEDEQQQQQQAGSSGMDLDAPAAAAAAVPGAGFTTQQLLGRVQASYAELLAELARLQAVQLGGVWRLVDATYLGCLLEMLVVTCMEQGWPVGAVPVGAAVAALRRDGYQPALVHHCLRVYGTPSGAAGAANAAGAAGGAAAAGAGGEQAGQAVALDERQVCLHYARKLLGTKPSWGLAAFLAAWRAEVPSCWAPHEGMLPGEALLLEANPSEGFCERRVLHFPAAPLPSAPGPRFAALFAAQPRWTRQQLDPYMLGLHVPGQTVEQLLIKFARASQRSPTDPELVFVAR